MFSTSSTAFLAYGVALAAAIVLGILVYWGAKLIRAQKRDSAIEDQLQELIGGEEEEGLGGLERGRTFSEKWVVYWNKIGTGTGIARYREKDNDAPRDVIIAWFTTAIVIGALMRNPIVGIVAGTIVLYGFTLLAKSHYNKQQEKIQEQIPGFLASIKPSIQANQTPSTAILKVVDTMPEPIKHDLDLVRAKINANASFVEAMQELVDKTSSNELRFLGTCLIQAAMAGTNIESQIDTIQSILDERRKAANELKKAVKGTYPAVFISSVAIPGSFIATYFIDPTAREFWFHTLLSWAALAVIGALYGLGMWLTHRMVEGIRNL